VVVIKQLLIIGAWQQHGPIGYTMLVCHKVELLVVLYKLV